MSRSVIDIDDELLDMARKLTGLTKKTDIMKLALDALVREKNIERIRELRGSIHWDGDLGEMRKDRSDTCR